MSQWTRCDHCDEPVTLSDSLVLELAEEALRRMIIRGELREGHPVAVALRALQYAQIDRSQGVA